MGRSQHHRRRLAAAFLHYQEMERQRERQEEAAEEEELEQAQTAVLMAGYALARAKREERRRRCDRMLRRRVCQSSQLVSDDMHVMMRKKSRRNRLDLRAAALVPVHKSPALELLLNGDDDAFIMGMGVNRKLFKFLLDRFTPAYNSRPLTLGAAPPTNAQVCYVLACACYSVTSLPLYAL